MSNRIEDAKNRVFVSNIGIGKDNPISLHTKETSIYRRTGMGQIADMINTGYIRPKEKVNGGHAKEVFWTQGGDKLFYYSKDPIIEVSASSLSDGDMGALSITELQGIWIFSEREGKYINRLSFFQELYNEYHEKKEISKTDAINLFK